MLPDHPACAMTKQALENQLVFVERMPPFTIESENRRQVKSLVDNLTCLPFTAVEAQNAPWMNCAGMQ